MVKAQPTAVDSSARPAPGLPRDRRLAELERAENFPVALRLLPRAAGEHLRAIYDVARVIDDTGDEGAGDHTAELLRLRAGLARVWTQDPPERGVLARLVPAVRAGRLEPGPFDRLIEANLRDQRVRRYPRRSDLLEYCTFSADPVGRLVLAVFGAGTPRTEALSDRVCTGLQLIEHCQDIGEDYHRGRIYLPQEDLHRFGVREDEFAAATTSDRLRRLIEFEAEFAAGLLNEGRPLLRLLHGPARLAVAGYLAGGLAALDALRRAQWQVLPAGPVPRRRDVVRHVFRLLSHSARPGSGRRS